MRSGWSRGVCRVERGCGWVDQVVCMFWHVMMGVEGKCLDLIGRDKDQAKI